MYWNCTYLLVYLAFLQFVNFVPKQHSPFIHLPKWSLKKKRKKETSAMLVTVLKRLLHHMPIFQQNNQFKF